MAPQQLKIILVNYRFFVSGGPERYMFNIISLLQRKGHQVFPFSIKSQHNSATAYDKYFLEPVGKEDAVYFSDQEKKSIGTILKSFGRMYYSTEAKRKLAQLIEDVQHTCSTPHIRLWADLCQCPFFQAATKRCMRKMHARQQMACCYQQMCI
jgi:hypothetical protein